MGTVWHARHPEGVDVAVKVVRPEYASQPEQAEAFRKEVRSVAFLDHPGIVHVYDFGVVPETVAEASGDRLQARSLWLSMEYAEGGTLGDQARIGSWRELYQVLLQILHALAHAHARGIVHRDLKPRNVLVHPRGKDPDADAVLEPDELGEIRVSLTDYGIAHALHREGADRAQAGTPGYMAPEQIRGDWRDLGPWTDLYSLGSLGWRLATGRSAFPGDRAPAVLFAQLHARTRSFEPAFEVPTGFEQWLVRLLQAERARRFSCAADAAEELVALDHGGPRSTAFPDWHTRLASAPSRPRGTGLALFVYRPWPLVGRERLQGELWSALRTVAQTGRAQVIVLRGYPGVGKTRLATWLAERSEELGLAWTLRPPPERGPRGPGRSGSGSFTRPGVALPTAVRRLLRLEELSADDTRQRLVDALAERGSSEPTADARKVEALLDQAFVFGQLNPRTLTPDDEAVQRWVALFDRLAHDRPLIVVVENLHVEPQAVALLGALVGTRRPLLVVATLDRTAQPAHLGAIQRLCERAKVFDIEALDPRTHRQMLDVGVGLVPRLAEQVVARTAGDLSLTVRLVTDWVRRSLLVPTSNGFDLREGADPRLTDAMCEELAARTDGLGGPRSEALLFLAALGQRRVRHDEWLEVCEVAQRPLRPDAIQAYVSRGLLEVEESSDGPRYTFIPPALREALLFRAGEQRQLERIHTVCAEVLVAKPKASAHERAVVHFAAAGLGELALHHLRELIERTMAEGQWRRLPKLLALERQLFDQLEVEARDPRRFRNEVDEMVAAEQSGETPDLEATRSVLTRTAANGDPGTSAQLARVILRAEARAGTLRHDDLLLMQARRWAEAARDKAAQVELLRLGGEAAWRRLDVPVADRLLSEAVDLAEATEDRVLLLALLGEVRGLGGSVEQGSVLVARALELALRNSAQGGTRAGLARALITQSILLRHRGDTNRALDLAQRAAIDLDAVGRDRQAPKLLGGTAIDAELQLALALISTGQIDPARGLLQNVIRGDDLDRRLVAAAGLLACATADGNDGQFDAALAEWRALADTDRGYHSDTVWPLEWAARRAIADGQVDRAQILLRQAAARFQHLGDPASADRMERQRRALTASSPSR